MAVTGTADVRAWFDAAGWKLEPGVLRAELEQRGCDTVTVIELIDEGADRRRAQPPPSPARTARPKPTTAPVPAASGSVPPQDRDAEESILGAAMISPNAIDACRNIIGGEDFFFESHARIWQAILWLHDHHEPVDPITLADRLDETGKLDDVGGRVRLHELAALVPASANAAHYARIVHETALLRGLIRAGGEIARLGWDRPDDTRALLEQARIIVEEATAQPLHEQTPPEAIAGGSFVFDEPDTLDAIRLWGDDTRIGWAAGEGLMLAGPDGVGKTTLGQQLALARAGLRTEILGMPVNADERRVLYIAADRPRQAARSLRRMLHPDQRQLLDERMTVWRGPLPQMLNDDRTTLARLAAAFDAGTVVVDSLKDVAVDLASDEAGGRIAACFQHLIAGGVELLVLHHPRKPGVSDNRKPRELADFYGSRLIYGAIGSAFMLWGEPGDIIVELRHLKQPVDEIGPLNLRHNHQAGDTTIERGSDLLDLVHQAGSGGLTPTTGAQLVYEKDAPNRNEIERVRRRLDQLVAADKLVKIPGRPGGTGGGGQSLYVFNGPKVTLT